MKWLYFIVLFLSSSAFGNLVSRVRLIDHIGYMTKVVTETVQRVEQKGWWNLKVPDVSFDINEIALRFQANGTIHYKNGFVASIHGVDLLQSSVNQRVNLNSAKEAQAIVTGTLRMHDVAIGYDVEAQLETGTEHYTVIYVHPILNFAFTLTKIIDQDEEIAVTVVGTVPASRNVPNFKPKNKATDVFTTLFNTSLSNEGIIAWGPEVFTPIAREVVNKHVEFPTLCYNCAA